MAWFTAILKLIAAVFEYYGRNQLIQTGKNEERLDVHKKEEEKRELAKKIVKENSTLPSDDIIVKLSKYRRDKDN